MKKFCTLASFFALGLPMCFAPAAQAEMADSEDLVVLSEATQLTPAEMQELRGGFVDTTGMIYSFAVDVRTAIGGAEVFSRSLTVSPTGPGGEFRATNISNIASVLPDNLTAEIVNNGAGLLLFDANGNSTLVLSQTETGVPTSIILNSGSDKDIRHTVQMSLQLNGALANANAARAAAAVARSNMHHLGF
jgi:hypothetical protein